MPAIRGLALDEEFRAAGLTAILGLGSAPGKTNLLASAAARRLGEDLVSMEIWAATRDPAAARAIRSRRLTRCRRFAMSSSCGRWSCATAS
jgi:saccharopine dehydrogenase-like NADP-dependent oxidoreductase